MGDFVGGSIAQAAGSVLSSMINAHTSSKNTKRAIAAQKEENELAYQRSVEQWERENDYNTPTAQMQRLRDAGLNPNLAYGTPNLASPNSPQYQPVDTSAMAKMPSMLGAGIEGAINGRYLNAVIDNMNADTEKKQEEAGKTSAETTAQLTYNKFQEQIITGILAEQKSRINLNTANASLADEQSFAAYTSAQRSLAEISQISTNIERMRADINLANAETTLKKLEAYYYGSKAQAEIAELYSLVGLNNASADLTREQKAQLAAQATYNILLKKEQANNAFLEGINLYYSGEQLNLDLQSAQWKFQQDKDWNNMERFTGVLGNLMLGAGAAAGGYSAVKRVATQPFNVRGFR